MILSPPKGFVQLRQAPGEPDDQDQKRVHMVRDTWASQDDLLRNRNRAIEESIRMLAGQQWSVYHPVLGKWMDVTEWMDEEERRWRQRPVFNRLLPWFILTHARATESQPIVTFAPGPDRIDSELAEVMDISFKSQWGEMGMLDVNDRLMAWVIAAGRAYLQCRVDASGGALREWIGTDLVPVVDENHQPIVGPDGQPLSQLADGVPFGPDGQPRAVFRAAGGDPSRGELVATGPAHTEREGKLVADVFSPLEVRGQWGPRPWHEKGWHATRQYMTPEEVYEQWGVEVEADVRGQVGDSGELERVLFGTGFFGAANSKLETQGSGANTDGFCEITTLWRRPCGYGGMEETQDSPGGRYTVVTPKKCLVDGTRPVAFPHTSPIRCFDFVRLPGRPSGTSPLEAMNPVQRAYNRGYAQIQEHVNLVTNPKGVIDSASGIKDGQFTNAPGDNYVVNRRAGVPAIEYVAPPPLGADVYKWMQMLYKELEDMGQLAGTSGEQQSPDQSGEAIKELRFNSDRFLGPTMRRAVEEYGRFVEDMRALLPLIWDEAKVISYAGEDNIARTITVLPHFFEEGRINVRPDVESMLPEGRGERQAKVYRLWQDGAWGPPLSPQALTKFHELARFPHLSRASKPGGIHRVTAEQFVGRLLQGEDPRTLPVFEWYDEAIHLGVLEEFMSAPEFLRQAPEIQQAMAFRRQVLQFQHSQKMQAQLAQQLAVQSALNPTGPVEGAKGGRSGGHSSSGSDSDSDSENDTGYRSLLPHAPAAPSDGVPGGSLPTAPMHSLTTRGN